MDSLCLQWRYTMSRTSAREHAFKILYQMQVAPEEIESTVDLYLENFVEEPVSDSDRAFIVQEIVGTTANTAVLDEKISGALKGWTLRRLSKVDLAILRLAVYEILHEESIPASVSINEAINLAKKYSQDAAPAFINGVLGSIVPEEASEAQTEAEENGEE